MGCRSYHYKYLHAKVRMEPYEIVAGKVADPGRWALRGWSHATNLMEAVM